MCGKSCADAKADDVTVQSESAELTVHNVDNATPVHRKVPNRIFSKLSGGSLQTSPPIGPSTVKAENSVQTVKTSAPALSNKFSCEDATINPVATAVQPLPPEKVLVRSPYVHGKFQGALDPVRKRQERKFTFLYLFAGDERRSDAGSFLKLFTEKENCQLEL